MGKDRGAVQVDILPTQVGRTLLTIADPKKGGDHIAFLRGGGAELAPLRPSSF